MARKPLIPVMTLEDVYRVSAMRALLSGYEPGEVDESLIDSVVSVSFQVSEAMTKEAKERKSNAD